MQISDREFIWTNRMTNSVTKNQLGLRFFIQKEIE